MTLHIIACIDGSSSATAVCDWAAWASARLQLPLTLLHVLDKPVRVVKPDLSGAIGLGSREDLLEELTQLDEKREKLALLQGKEMLAAAKARAEQDGAIAVETLQRHGSLVETLAELEHTVRLVVIGRQGEHTDHQLAQVGSQLESVIRTLHCPILVAMPGFKVPQRLMLAYDGSATANTALARLIESPLLKGLPCHLVMAGDDQDGKMRAAETKLTQAGVSTTSVILPAEHVNALGEHAEQQAIDLIIMGAYGHSRIRQFFVGSNTSSMLRTTRTPLLLLR